MDTTDVGDPLELLQAGSIRSVEYSGGRVVVDAPRPGRVYLPGSFNPLHDGHRHASSNFQMPAGPHGRHVARCIAS